LTQTVALGGSDLSGKERRRELVGLIHHHEIPVGLIELGLDILVAA
jgi:hypothetical protein